MTKCKALDSLIFSGAIIAVSGAASAESFSYKEYMERKRYPELYEQEIIPYALPVTLPPAPVIKAKEYAMRPAAPYIDVAVPQAKQKKIRKEVKRKPTMQDSGYLQEPVYTQIAPQPVYTPQPAPVKAEEDDKVLGGKLSGSVGFTTDYVFRGVSQSRESPAVQGGVEYEHDIGTYIGLWGSNVDFRDSDEAQTEFDVYGGYRTALTDNLNADVGVIYYAYPGSNKNRNYDYVEFYSSMEYSIPVNVVMGTGFDIEKASVGLGVNYSPENFGETGQATYVKATAAAPFANGLTLDGHVGRQWVEDNVAFALPDYVDWSLGMAYALPRDFEVKLQYFDTNINQDDCADGCDGKAVATLSKSF